MHGIGGGAREGDVGLFVRDASSRYMCAHGYWYNIGRGNVDKVAEN